jgi:hydroxymethylpyrimidine/phosphomethylpyrimidine kinase
MPPQPPVVLTIAGFDPSSGAGITADIKTIAAHECYGVASSTALTVQSTQGVRRVQAVDPGVLAESLECLASDIGIQGVHVGMLANEENANAVADFLERTRLPHVVIDPILRSSSGAELLDAAGARVMVERLFPLAEVVTPNLDEAIALASAQLGGKNTIADLKPQSARPGDSAGASLEASLETMRRAARSLHGLGAANVVVTGGHLQKAIDLLSFSTAGEFEEEVFKAERQQSTSTHGTGCAFACALACHLAHGRGIPEAVLLAKAYISAAISNAYPVGKGTGPLNHLYRMTQQRRSSQIVAEREASHSRN